MAEQQFLQLQQALRSTFEIAQACRRDCAIKSAQVQDMERMSAADREEIRRIREEIVHLRGQTDIAEINLSYYRSLYQEAYHNWLQNHAPGGGDVPSGSPGGGSPAGLGLPGSPGGVAPGSPASSSAPDFLGAGVPPESPAPAGSPYSPVAMRLRSRRH